MRTEPIVRAERNAFLRTQIDAVYGLNLPLIVMDTLGCVLIASFCWSPAAAPALGLWLAINAVAMLLRAGAAIAYRTGRLPAVSTWGWAAVLVVGAAFDGIMWGLAIVWVVATGSDNQVMVVMCVALSALTLSIANIAYWPVYAAFAAPVSLSAAVGFAMSDRYGSVLLSIGALAMTAALLMVSHRLARSVLRAQRLAVDNQQLVDSLARRSHELEEACRILETVSRTDPLTGLANRRSGDACLAREWARAQRYGGPLGVVAIDVDRFKRYNDTHGHAEGDRCLQAVAAIIAKGARGPTDLAVRPGGEEFLLILPGATLDDLRPLAERLRRRVARETAASGLMLRAGVTISLGLASFEPAAGLSADDLVRAADAALYRAKMGGRNRYECAPARGVNAAAAA
ncbi:diguanylate cyclase [Hephaestia sp. GCM10023244]|uniref:GGDEF domain-containing protein n=1 Tax=unclassified Hephaestia TaxID=2631281 RepID=UPI002076ED79|nr:GGDEF domain-containing protein [Hephaestia sp. MAHUQ-44]MCM8730187.1 GGDEF domain-containing protein [Hephaestia sp. MAHUQ-44]